LPKHELVCGSELAWDTKKVKLLLNGSHLEPLAVRSLRPRGDDNME
jgi:hypothetical protein